MALSRKKWNYIIIFASIMMISVLSFLDDKTQKLPSDALHLFDDATPLVQLQLDQAWLRNQNGQWQCAVEVLNCSQWAAAWQHIQVSPFDFSPDDTQGALPLVILVGGSDQAQHWQFYPQLGLLVSASNNHYQIPPSLRADLMPVLDISK